MGQIVFEALQQTAGRRAVLRDRDAFPLFVEAVKSVEPAVAQTVARVAREVDVQTTDRMSDAIRRIFGRVLKELADLDNPMRSPTGAEPGEGGVLELLDAPAAERDQSNGAGPGAPSPPGLSDLMPPPVDPVSEDRSDPARPDRAGSSRLPSLAPDPQPGEVRSRFDEGAGIVYFNDTHADYLLVKDSEPALLDYFATLVAKELVVFNNPRSAPEELGEELVRMLVRVRRYLPRRA
jgi:hypothetical protein